MTNVIVEASEAWPVVAAGLGSAVIVASATLEVARRQRQADSDRLDRQLAHDRDMRDLQHLRETLAPIIARTLNWEALLSLHKALSSTQAIYRDERATEHARPIIDALAKDVGEESERGRTQRGVQLRGRQRGIAQANRVGARPTSQARKRSADEQHASLAAVAVSERMGIDFTHGAHPHLLPDHRHRPLGRLL